MNRWIILLSALALGTLLALGVSMPQLQRFIEQTGIYVPVRDVYADFVWGCVWASILGISILAWPVPRRHKAWLTIGWLAKCAVALIVMLPYEARYASLDCWIYFQRAHTSIFTIPWTKGGADFVVAVSALHLKIGPDSYHAMKITFALIGLIAAYLFYRCAELLLERPSPLAFFGLCLYPTVLFWSSILGKDPIVLLGIAIHIWGLLNVAVRHRYKHLLTCLAGVALASIVRIWLGPILLIPAAILLSSHIRHTGWRVVTLAAAVLPLVILVPATVDRLKLNSAYDLFEASQVFNSGWDQANSSLDIQLNTTWDLVSFIPESIFIAYFRPLPGDLPHLLGNLAGLENLALLLLAIGAVFRFRLPYLRNHLFLWSAILLLTWGGAYGLVAYKDLGTAVRFKLQIVPVVLGMLWFLLSRPRVVRRVMQPLTRRVDVMRRIPA